MLVWMLKLSWLGRRCSAHSAILLSNLGRGLLHTFTRASRVFNLFVAFTRGIKVAKPLLLAGSNAVADYEVFCYKVGLRSRVLDWRAMS